MDEIQPPPVSPPPPLQGCLVCHAEGTLELLEPRRIPLIGDAHPRLECSACQSVAWLDWDEKQPEEWRIRYRSIPPAQKYAAGRFKGWLLPEEALAISTDVYVHRQRLLQIEKGDLGWLKPRRLDPPPPLMNPDELVYLTLKPASFCEATPSRLPAFFQASPGNVLDTGTFYLTDSKIHLLGQRRDRSNRLSEVVEVAQRQDQWFIYVNVGDKLHYYQGMGQSELLDATLLASVMRHLVQGV